MGSTGLENVPEELLNYTDLTDFPDFDLNPVESLGDLDPSEEVDAQLFRLFDVNTDVNDGQAAVTMAHAPA